MAYFDELDNALALGLATGVTVYMKGPPGTGKSSRFFAVARALDYHPLVVRPAQCEPADLAGFPVPSVDPHTGSPRLSFIPGPVVAEACRVVDEGGRVGVLVDELNQANPSQQGPVMGVAYDRRAGGIRLPDAPELAFVFAGNPPANGGSDIGYELSPALSNRCAHYEVLPAPSSEWVPAWQGAWPTPKVERLDLDAYRRELSVVRSRVGAFLLAKPGLLHAMPTDPESQGLPWPSPRTWDESSKMLAAAKVMRAHEAGARLVRGLVGTGAASELTTYLTELDLPSPLDVLTGRVPVPTDPQRRDRTRVTLDGCADYVCDRLRDHDPDAPRLVRGCIDALLATEAAGLVDMTLKATKRLDSALAAGGSRPADLAELVVRIEPVIKRAKGLTS